MVESDKYETQIKESRERMQRARSFREPDRVPVFIDVEAGFLCRLCGVNIRDYYLDIDTQLEVQTEGLIWCLEELRDDRTGISLHYDAGVVGEGVVFDCPIERPDDTDPVIVPRFESLEQLEQLRIPDVSAHPGVLSYYQKYETFKEKARGHGWGLPVTGGIGIHPPLSAACAIMEPAKVYEYLSLEPERMRSVFQKLLIVYCDLVDYKDRYFGTRTTSLAVPDDNSGFISAEMYRRMVLPYNAEIFNRYGKDWRYLHMDGPADQLFAVLADELGISEMDIGGFSSIDAATRTMKGKVVIRGNVNCRDLYSDFDVRAKSIVDHCIRTAGPGGGYIFGVGGGCYAGVNVNTVVAMVEYAKAVGSYPIDPEGPAGQAGARRKEGRVDE